MKKITIPIYITSYNTGAAYQPRTVSTGGQHFKLPGRPQTTGEFVVENFNLSDWTELMSEKGRAYVSNSPRFNSEDLLKMLNDLGNYTLSSDEDTRKMARILLDWKDRE